MPKPSGPPWQPPVEESNIQLLKGLMTASRHQVFQAPCRIHYWKDPSHSKCTERRAYFREGCIHMNDGSTDHLCNVRCIPRRTAKLRRRRESNLVVDYKMNRTTNSEVRNVGEAQSFLVYSLSWYRSISVDLEAEDSRRFIQSTRSVVIVMKTMLFGTTFPHRHWMYSL